MYLFSRILHEFAELCSLLKAHQNEILSYICIWIWFDNKLMGRIFYLIESKEIYQLLYATSYWQLTSYYVHKRKS